MKNNLLKSWRLFLATIMLLSLGITNAWGAPALTNVPTGTFTLPTFEDEWTWNSVIDNPYEVSGNYIVFNANVLYQSAKSNNQPWIKLIGGGTSSADWTAPESTPFVGSANWKKDESAVNTYATVKTESDRVFYFRVKNCLGAKALVKSGSNKKRTIYLDAYELTEGVAATTAAKTASMESSTMDVISITGLDAEKEYLIVVYSICSGTGGSSSGNSNFFEIAFEKPASSTPVCPGTLTIPASKSLAEGEKLEIASTLSAGNGTITYQWYKGELGEGVAISGATSSKYTVNSAATADAGKYYCVASKAECTSATSGICEVSVEADSRCFVFTKAGKPTSGNLAAGDAITATGGSMKVYSTKSESSIKWASDGLNFSGGAADQVIVELNNLMKEGTVITLVNKNNALKLLAEDGSEVTNFTATGGSYTVTATDKLVGNNVFRIQRNGSSYLQSLEVTNCGDEPTYRTVTFDADGGSAVANKSVVDGKKLVAPTAPTKEGYAFVKWVVASTEADYDFNAAVTADLALKAVWVKTWTITFDMNGATSAAIAALVVNEGSKATKPEDPELTGSAFAGWYYGDPETEFDFANTTISKDYTLKAKWVTSVKVTYYDGSTKLAEVDNEKGAVPSGYAEYQVKKLHTFVKWYTDAALETEADMTAVLNADATFYGKWEKKIATDVDFETAAKGSASVADVIAAHNMATTGGATSWDTNTSSNNGSYLGLKMKEANSTVEFYAPAAKMVVLKVGILVNSKSEMYKDGVKVSENMAGGSKTDGDNFNLYYYYSDEVALYKFQTTAADAQIIKAISFEDPYTVTFTVPEGADAVEAKQFKAEPIVLPTAVKGAENFIGWFDAATAGNKIGEAGDSYSPAGDVELFAQFEAVSSDNTISSLKYKKTGDAEYTVIAITDENQKIYNVEIPYKTTVAEVVYEKSHAAATAGDVALNAGVATFKVTAESGAEADYTVNFTNAPKDGVCLIHADITGNGAASVDATKSAIGGTAAANSNVKNSSTYDGKTGYKFNASGAKFNMALAEGDFKAGDVVKVFITTAQAMPIRVYSDEAASNEVATGAANMVQGENTVVLTANASTLWLVRTDANSWNPNVAYVEVYRPMNPVLTAVTFDGVAGVIAGTNITATLPWDTDLDNLTINYTVASNDNAHVTKTIGAAWESGVANTITLTDKDDDQTVYNVTLTLGAAYTITCNSAEHGSVSASLAKASVGTEVTITTTPATGYELATLSVKDAADNDVEVAAGKFTMPASNVTITATFQIPYVAVTSVTITGPTEVKMGATIQLTATVAPENATNKDITWTCTDASGEYMTFTSGNPTTITPVKVTSGKSFTATADGKSSSSYSVKVYALISFDVNGGNAVDPMKSYGSNQTMPTPTHPSGYAFLGWYKESTFVNKVAESWKSGEDITLYAKWELPDAETPVITTQPVGATYDEGDAMTPLTVVVETVSDGGTLSYQWYNGSTEVGSNSDSYTPTEAGTYKVIVTNTLAGHNSVSTTSNNAVIVVNHGPTTLQDVTESYTWDWTKAGTADAAIDSYTEGVVLANVTNVVNDANFWSDKLFVIGQWGYRSTNQFFQGTEIRMHTTVPGFMKISYRCTDKSKNVKITVNGVVVEEKSGDFKLSEEFYVEGDVVIELEGDGGAKLSRVNKIVFTAATFDATIRTGLTAGNFGTMCQAKAIEKIGGAIVYEIENTNPIGIDLVEAELPLTAGKPYIYQATHSEIRVIYAAGDAATSVAEANGLVGNLSTAGGTISIPEGSYVIQHNNLCKVVSAMNLPADRAYINYGAIVDNSGAAAPSRRRVTMGGAQTDTPTDIDEVSTENNAVKYIENGVLYILRDGKVFNAQGQLVK